MPNKNDIRPRYPEGYKVVWTGNRYDGLINFRVWSSIPKWGFVIFRGTYGNDAEWNTFIALLEQSVVKGLQFAKLEDELRSDFEWTIIEDRANLEGASKDTVRARFLDWVAARSVERDGVHADAPWVTDYVPRYRSCIYVDDTCFQSIGARHTGRTTNSCLNGGKLVIINSLYQPCDNDTGDETDDDEKGSDESEDEDEYISVEGNTDHDVGWTYIHAVELGSIYSTMCYADAWDSVYRNNHPDHPPEARRGQPLSAVERVWVAGSSLAPEYQAELTGDK